MVTSTLPQSFDPLEQGQSIVEPLEREPVGDQRREVAADEQVDGVGEAMRVLHRPADGELLHQQHEVAGRDRLVVEGHHGEPAPDRAVVEDVGDDAGPIRRPR